MNELVYMVNFQKIGRASPSVQQRLLIDFLMKTILNGRWRKRLRKMWLLRPTQVCSRVNGLMDDSLTTLCPFH